MKRCPACSYPNPDNRTQCFKCSASLDVSSNVVVQQQVPNEADQPTTSHGQPAVNAPVNTSPTKQVNWQSAISALIFLLVIGYILYCVFAPAPETSDPSSTTSVGSSNVPAVEVTGSGASMVTFTDWKNDGGMLTAKITFCQGLTSNFSIKCSSYDASGVKLAERYVDFPSLQAGETGMATTFLPPDTNPVRVVIEVTAGD